MSRYVGTIKLSLDIKRSVKGFELCQELALLRDDELKQLRENMREKYKHNIFSEENIQKWSVESVSLKEPSMQIFLDEYFVYDTNYWEEILPKCIASYDTFIVSISYGSNDKNFANELISFFKPYLIANHNNKVGVQESWYGDDDEDILVRGKFDDSWCKYCKNGEKEECEHKERCKELHDCPCSLKQIEVGDYLWKANETGYFVNEIKAIIKLKDGMYFSFQEPGKDKDFELISLSRIGEMYFLSMGLIPVEKRREADLHQKNIKN